MPRSRCGSPAATGRRSNWPTPTTPTTVPPASPTATTSSRSARSSRRTRRSSACPTAARGSTCVSPGWMPRATRSRRRSSAPSRLPRPRRACTAADTAVATPSPDPHPPLTTLPAGSERIRRALSNALPQAPIAATGAGLVEPDVHPGALALPHDEAGAERPERHLGEECDAERFEAVGLGGARALHVERDADEEDREERREESGDVHDAGRGAEPMAGIEGSRVVEADHRRGAAGAEGEGEHEEKPERRRPGPQDHRQPHHDLDADDREHEHP